MPLRNARPFTFRPTTACDCADGTNGPPGAMLALTNLIPSPFTDKTWVPRPASQLASSMIGFASPGFISAWLVVGDIGYGMVASMLNPGQDQPFAINLATGNFLPISGITAANTPESPPTTGAWTPPIIAQVGTRIIVTHPGFPGGETLPVQLAQFLGNTTAGSPFITGFPAIQNENLVNQRPYGPELGSLIFGSGIPPGATVTSLRVVQVVTDVTGTSGNTFATVSDPTGILPGMVLFCDVALIVTSVVGSTVNFAAPLDTNLTGQPFPFIGSVLGISEDATVTATGSTLTVASPTGTLFGWFDISGFSETIAANTTTGLPVLSGNINTVGIQPGLAVSGPGIPAGTFVTGTDQVVIDAGNSTIVSGSNTATLVDFIPPRFDLIVPGMVIAGEGIPFGSTVVSVTTVGQSIEVTMSLAATTSAVVSLTFSGGIIGLSQGPTETAQGASIVLTGGTPTAPLWGAGNTDANPLLSVPVAVAQMGGSAFYAVGNAVVQSDPLLPCSVTDAGQVLTFANGLNVTALGPLPLNSLLGGIVQAIIAFQGVTAMQQITGSAALNNLAVNQLPVPTGTLAPLSVVPTTLGLAFVSPEGVRIISFTCQVSDPIGDGGHGIAAPFIFCAIPSRICAAGGADTLRISVPNALAYQSMTQEFWWDFTRKVWSGPHTFPASLIQPWRDTFILSAVGINAKLWQSDAIPNLSADFTENGLPMGFLYATSLMPENGAMAENAVVETTLMFALPAANQISVGFNSDEGIILDSQILFGIQKGPSLYNVTNWGQGYWGSAGAPSLLQRQIKWSRPLVFKQGAMTAAGLCCAGLVLGDAFIRYQILGYLLERAS